MQKNKKGSETGVRFFTLKRLCTCTIRLEPLCLDSAFSVRAAEVRKTTVERYNYSQQDEISGVPFEKVGASPFMLG